MSERPRFREGGGLAFQPTAEGKNPHVAGRFVKVRRRLAGSPTGAEFFR
jgi:hypothetical protein